MAVERYVLTGGTYSGKTSMVEFLQKEGFQVFPEAIIASRDELKKAGSDYHKEPYKWTELIIRKAIEDFESAKEGVNFYDRGMPCCAVFAADRAPLLYDKILDLSRSMRYSSPVFFLETIKPFAQHRRDISEDTNKDLEEKIRTVYQQLGYKAVEIPYFSSDAQKNNLRRKELILSLCSKF